MNKVFVGACLAVACVGLVVYANSKPADFSEQFITLPSGYQAYCNRQGYREISTTQGNVLVTDEGGEFVPCDARVGPTWDNDRRDENGNLLTLGQMNQKQVDKMNRMLDQDRDEARRSKEERIAKGKAFVERKYARNTARCQAAQLGSFDETIDKDRQASYQANCKEWNQNDFEVDMRRAEAGWLCVGNTCDDE